MVSDFLLYGSTGFVGRAIARNAVRSDLQPILAGRNAKKVRALADELGLEHRIFGLDDVTALDAALKEVSTVLHCAGPFIHTFKPMIDSCLRTKTHYLDLTGEIRVYESLAARHLEATEQEVMILPGVGFDIVPTDCLALHLKQRLPSATHLTLAFHSDGPAGLPPGTAKTFVEMIPYGNRIRRNGWIVPTPDGSHRMIDFGHGPNKATRLTWGDIFMAYHSTGIPNIEEYAVFSEKLSQLVNVISKFRRIFNLPVFREMLKLLVPAGSTAEDRAKTRMHVWGEVEDDQGQKAAARLHGPEGGVTWTVLSALAVVQKVLNRETQPGFQTPSLAFGADFALECEGVTREDLR